ncbi:MAG TPA: sulfur oxidation c-type cytochrome SoxA [Burkholderiaceae bacterium]|nr:sulfur oxidation c-type cytochrome SoxA [Burkholderiaceae bacterium]
MKKTALVACLLALGGVMATTGALAQDTADGIAEYRAMLGEGGNPAELTEMAGEDLWFETRGPKQASLEQCDLGAGPGVIEGVYARLPRYFEDAGRVMDLESRLIYCMETLQGFERDEIVKTAVSGSGEYASDMESLVAYVVAASRGVTIEVPQDHPMEREAYERGKQIFYFRGGPYDFSCSSCHAVTGQRIRLQDLPNLNEPELAQRAYSSWPAYRVSQGALRTMQWRLRDCFRQQRMPVLKYGSQASVDLITYLAVNASGGQMDAPGLKR